VTAATVAGPAGVAQTAGSSVLGPTLYVSFTQQLRTDALLPRDREPCLVDDINGTGLLPGFYLGRLAGSYTSLPVYEVGGSGSVSGAGSGVSFAKCLVATPTGGLYDARLQKYNENGTLSDTGESVWLRECNLLTTLVADAIYLCGRTGRADGRWVYTLDDFDLIVGDESFTQIVLNSLYVSFGPDNNWTITKSSDRTALVKRILTIREETTSKVTFCWQMDFSPATAWDVTATATGHATIERLLNIREGTTTRTTHTWQVDFDSTDFDVAATATGHATVNTEGATEAFYVLTNCVAGVLKKKLLTFTRGLLKSVGAEIDL
jgi:hypothetical protein